MTMSFKADLVRLRKNLGPSSGNSSLPSYNRVPTYEPQEFNDTVDLDFFWRGQAGFQIHVVLMKVRVSILVAGSHVITRMRFKLSYNPGLCPFRRIKALETPSQACGCFTGLSVPTPIAAGCQDYLG